MFFISNSSSTSSNPFMLKITSEDFCHFKETKQNMKEQKMNASDMHLKTSETIYQITVEIATRAIHMLEKGSKTYRLIASHNKTHEEYKEILLKMEIKLEPAKTDFVIECWLKKDTAQKVAQEHKERIVERKKAKKAASATVKKLYVNFPIEE
ncbi:hypothetical protein CRE_14801 [Caenorhabditis remanei]|uniref:Uncharacterized protein n=1 Tax=Caenorhabditis remanei TaxID=31234 RepID=E3MRT3_CAERE|nr:hypothetical protein CRE_14801 [Caenorhabditis remanei]